MPGLSLPAERPGTPAPPDLAERRAGITRAVEAGMLRTDPPAEERVIGGVRCLVFHPLGSSAGTLLHFHGGGFRLGAPETVGAFAAALAGRCGVTVICPAYRLAPEHPFPAGLKDALSVQQALAAGGERKLILSGDSAGGGIAASLALLAAAGEAPPIGLILLSAWLDLTVSDESFTANGPSDPLFSGPSAREAARQYLQGHNAEDPLASSLFADLSRFPPTLLSAGTGEVLVADSQKFHAKLQAVGVPSTLSLEPGMEHVAVTRSLALSGAAETFAAISTFIEEITR